MKKILLTIPPLVLSLALSACSSSGGGSAPASIDNAPSSSATGQASDGPSLSGSANSYADRNFLSDASKQDTLERAAKVSGVAGEQASADEQTFSRVVVENVATSAHETMLKPIETQYNEVIKPHLNANVQGMKWLTLFALGGTLDKASVVAEGNGLVSANIVSADGQVLATVRGAIVSDSSINPVGYSETQAGAQYRADRIEVSSQWPR